MVNVCIMSSRETEERGHAEGCGITFLEADAFGLSSIGDRSSGNCDTIEDAVTGLLIDPEDRDQIADALRSGHRKAKQRFDLEKMLDRWRKPLASCWGRES